MTKTDVIDKVFDIMVVDDTLANLQVLMELLKNSGYKVRPIPKGNLALKAAKNTPPDLILLDINMPEMNGYELCQVLKADPKLKDIPVIFISALNQTEDKIKAFEYGGVDYITKPFHFQEVLARVKTHLKLNRLQQEMLQKNQVLAQNLAHLEHLESLRDSLVHMIVHDLRSPLSGVMGYLSLLELYRSEIPPQIADYINKANQNTTILLDMINNLLDLHRFESEQMPLFLEKIEITEVIEEGVRVLGALLDNITLEKSYPKIPVEFRGDRQILRRIITNLVGNAIKFNPPEKPLKITLKTEAQQIQVSIQDQGPGIPKAYQETIFDKFVQVEARQNKTHFSSGLGLTFCQLAARAHGGEITIQSELGQGSTFTLTLPIPSMPHSPSPALG